MGRLVALKELTRARVLLFWREPEAVFWVLVFPLILAITLGWAFKDRGLQPERIGVYAPVATARVEALRNDLAAAGLLEAELIDDEAEANGRLRRGQISVLVLAGSPPVLRYDPQRPEAELARLRIMAALAATRVDARPVETEEVTETGSRYIDWLFPGLLGMNLMGTGLWGIGFAIAEMRQKKLLRRFLVTPMRKSAFMLSFVLSRGVFLVVEAVVLVAFALFVLGVPLRGSVVGFAVLCVVGTLTFTAMGLLVSSRARTIEGVSGIMNLVMLPMWLFSGIFFSYERFPEAVHPFIRLIPLTALNDSIRALMLDGSSLASLGSEIAVQLTWAVVCFLAAIRIFRWE